MGWASATRNIFVPPKPVFKRPEFPIEKVDYAKLVSLDFETFYDDDYTLSKLSTSEYIRDPRFETLMVGIKIGNRKRVVIPGPKAKAALKAVDWSTHSLLCHNTQFDGFILSHHYGIVPKKYYCSLSMARGLHSNEIGAGLDEVAQFYGRAGKLKGSLEKMKGRRYKQLVAEGLYDQGAEYCGVDVDEMLGIFIEMIPAMPRDEMRPSAQGRLAPRREGAQARAGPPARAAHVTHRRGSLGSARHPDPCREGTHRRRPRHAHHQEGGG
jgi:hypothetical protein